MNITQRGIDFIKSWEGFREHAYQDSAGIWSIGYGTVLYENLKPVKRGDKITQAQATILFAIQLKKYEKAVNDIVTSMIHENQFDALVSFAYNVGIASLKRSTLLKKVNANPNDPNISTEFRKWNRAAGKFVQGLSNRRIAESQIYFSHDEPLPPSSSF